MFNVPCGRNQLQICMAASFLLTTFISSFIARMHHRLLRDLHSLYLEYSSSVCTNKNCIATHTNLTNSESVNKDHFVFVCRKDPAFSDLHSTVFATSIYSVAWLGLVSVIPPVSTMMVLSLSSRTLAYVCILSYVPSLPMAHGEELTLIKLRLSTQKRGTRDTTRIWSWTSCSLSAWHTVQYNALWNHTMYFLSRTLFLTCLPPFHCHHSRFSPTNGASGGCWSLD
jgi:hypothetical protein